MTRFEFTIKLRKALSGRVNHVIVNDNVACYENYIDAEMKKGRKEKEILEELGDPRLIAKTIIDTAKESDRDSANEKEGTFSDRFFGGRFARLPSWLFWIVFLLIFIIIFKLVGIMLGVLLPLLLPVLLVYYLVRYFRKR